MPQYTQMSTMELEDSLDAFTDEMGGYEVTEGMPEDGNVCTDNGVDFPFWWQVADQPWYPAKTYRDALIAALELLES